VAQALPASTEKAVQVENTAPGLHDFDFLVGHWQVHHRKLKKRLANNHEWAEFEGTLHSQPLMGGYANVDDDVFDVPGGAYCGVAPRSFDAKSGQWSIWWMDSRTPTAPMDPPVKGSFHNGVGTFYADYMNLLRMVLPFSVSTNLCGRHALIAISTVDQQNQIGVERVPPMYLVLSPTHHKVPAGVAKLGPRIRVIVVLPPRAKGGTGRSSIRSRSEHRNRCRGSWRGAPVHWATPAMGRTGRCSTEAR
jgi:hypothetical protein